MSAKIYSPPSALKQPELSFSNVNKYREECDTYIQNLKKMLSRRNKGKNVGEIIQFPVADGYAQYMVASMRPLELVHIPLWDAWEFEYVHLLNAKEVQNKIDQQNAINKLFSKKE